MRRALAVLLALGCAVLWYRHVPRRVPLGWRCARCGKAARTELELLAGDGSDIAVSAPDQTARLHGWTDGKPAPEPKPDRHRFLRGQSYSKRPA